MGARRLSSWEVFRPQVLPDGQGGQTVTLTEVRSERGDVRELTGRELMEARQAGAEHTHAGYFRVRADIRRNDELRSGDSRIEVLTVSPSFPDEAARLRVFGRTVEAGG